jgi:DNA-binding winged helix-turn-helix (wHTH) protein
MFADSYASPWPITVERLNEKVFLDGVPLALPSLSFRFVLMLAERAGEVISGKDLSAALAPTRADFQAARQAKLKLIQAIERAFRGDERRAPRDLDQLITTSKKGFCLGGGVVMA